ncbi:hypothetical protein EJB05_38880, partial [Eragrostis curvula]
MSISRHLAFTSLLVLAEELSHEERSAHIAGIEEEAPELQIHGVLRCLQQGSLWRREVEEEEWREEAGMTARSTSVCRRRRRKNGGGGRIGPIGPDSCSAHRHTEKEIRMGGDRVRVALGGGEESRSMALALRLRRTLAAAAAAASSSLLRPAASPSLSQPLPLASIVPLLPPGAAGGFQSRAAVAVRARGYSGVAEDNEISPDNGCDYKHWLVTMDFPDPKPSREEMIETYLKTLAMVVGSYEEAKKRMYAFSTTRYTGFQAVMTEDMTEEFYGEHDLNECDKYDNGVITKSRPPYPYWGKSSRPDRTSKDSTALSPSTISLFLSPPPPPRRRRRSSASKPIVSFPLSSGRLALRESASLSRPHPRLGGEKMIRRFVNVVAKNFKSGMYSLHRLDVSKHLFYPSVAEAEAAALETELKRKSSGWAPQIPTLECLPAHSICFQPTPTTRWDKPYMDFFALLSPRRSENRIFCSTDSGHSVLYNADSQCVQCMPSLQDDFIGRRPITISTGPPSAPEEDLFILHPGAHLSRFHVLRFGSKDRMDHFSRSRKGWLWESLPPLPFGGIINSHTLIDGGRTICVSSIQDVWGTYCFDTVEREWWEAGDWVLPFEGGAEYIPDLNLWLGFSLSKHRHLCATSDLSTLDKPPMSQVDMPYLETPDDWSTLKSDILNLGEGKFCIVEIFETARDASDSGSEDYIDLDAEFAVLTGVELVTSSADGDRKLEGLRTHKSRCYTFMQDQIEWVI